VKPVLLDASAIVALLDRSETYHDAAVAAVAELAAPLITCEPVIAEACYLLRRVDGAGEAIVENVETGIFQIPFRLAESAREVRRLMHKDRDHAIDLADACLIHLANEFGAGQILTLDRDFRIFRWGRNQAFDLMIPLT